MIPLANEVCPNVCALILKILGAWQLMEYIQHWLQALFLDDLLDHFLKKSIDLFFREKEKLGVFGKQKQLLEIPAGFLFNAL